MSMRLVVILLWCFPLSLWAQPEGPQEPSTEEQLAGQFYNSGEWQKAADLYETLFDQRPVNFYYSQLLQCYLQLKDFKGAEKLVSKQVRRNPGQPAYAVDMAWLTEQMGDGDKARKQYEKVLKDADYRDERMVRDLANALEGKRKPELAIRVYEQARREVPMGYRYNVELARIYDKLGQTDRVLQEYLEVLNTMGPVYMDQVQQSLQDILADDADGKKAELIRTQLLKEIQKNPDNLVYSDLLVWFFIQRRDFESALVQAKALDKRFRENGTRVYELGRLAISNDQYEAGKMAFLYVIEKGPGSDLYIFARKELSVAMYRKLAQAPSYAPEELTQLRDLLDKTYAELGPSENSAQVGIRLAHVMAFFQNQGPEALALLENLGAPQSGLMARTAAEVKLEMADIQLLAGDPWEATLLYSQVEKAMKTDTLGQEAKYRNARLAYFRGDFEWAKAQLDVLKAATSKLIANDALELSLLIGDNLAFDTTGVALSMFSRADMAYFQNHETQALQILDSLETLFPESTLNDDLLLRRAKIFQKQARFPEAILQLERILSNHRSDILADNALFMLAGLYDYQLKNTEKAMELYKELLESFPGSLYVVDARKRYRSLRGDVVQ